MEDHQKKITQKSDSSIDFGAIWAAIKKYKKLYYKTLGVAFVMALIIGFSLPKTYNCKILLAPETGGGSSNLGGLAALASSFGVSVGAGGQGGDAITPNVYPELMRSTSQRICSLVVVMSKKF